MDPQRPVVRVATSLKSVSAHASTAPTGQTRRPISGYERDTELDEHAGRDAHGAGQLVLGLTDRHVRRRHGAVDLEHRPTDDAAINGAAEPFRHDAETVQHHRFAGT